MPENARDDLLKEVESHLTINEEQLYTMLIPKDNAALYSPKGRLARGKQIFEAAFVKVRPTVCAAYNKARHDVHEIVELIVLIALALQADPHLGHTPLVPFSVLIVRHGLDKLCEEK